MASQTPFTCRWAFLSCSAIASVFLPDIILERPADSKINHSIVAVSTTGKRARVESWLAEHKVSNASDVVIFEGADSWKTMLAQGDFDAVYISTPHPLHYEHVKAALEAGRHVLVEKPATMNRAQYARLCEIAREKGCVLMEAMWTRYLPAATYFQNELLARLGDIRRVYAEFSFPIFSPDMSLDSRFLDKNAGAGALLDQGVYALTWVDMALHGLESAKSPEEMATLTEVQYANAMSVPGVPNEIDDLNTVILTQKEKKSGAQTSVAVVTTSMTLAGSNKPAFYVRFQAKKAAPSVRIEGSRGSVAIPFPLIRPEELIVQWYGPEDLDAEGREKDEVITKKVERGWGIWYQADVLAEAIATHQKGQGVVVGEQESLRVLGWLDEARKRAGIVYEEKLELVN
jgi:dihydrodiol dehydrogenase / D-xylose 1-dehydrogenase (NADP)